MRRRLYYCDHLAFPLPAGHRFPQQKYRLLREMLEAEDLFGLEAAPPAEPAIVEKAHDPGYVRAFLAGALDAATMRRIGFPWSPGLVQRTLASVGGTLAAAADALATGFGGTLAGGTHHAFYDTGAGFCVFNDIAVAIRHFKRRAAVIDLDVHQGDGTAALFEDDPEVFTLSLHAGANFPFRKQRSTLDVELADGTGDEAYLAVLESCLPRALASRPEIVFYQSGVDGLAADRLGRLRLTHRGLEARDRLVLEACRGIPLVITLGGGYAEPILETARAHATTFRLAARLANPGPSGAGVQH